MQSLEHSKMPVEEQVQEPIEIVWITPEMFLKKRTWAQMIADEEEEEEQDRIREEQERLRQQQEKWKNIMAARRFLYSIGQYELEDGEILE